MKQTRNTYRVRVTGSEDTIEVEVKRCSAYMARKYAVNLYIGQIVLTYGEPIRIDSVEVELLPA